MLSNPAEDPVFDSSYLVGDIIVGRQPEGGSHYKGHTWLGKQHLLTNVSESVYI